MKPHSTNSQRFCSGTGGRGELQEELADPGSSGVKLGGADRLSVTTKSDFLI